MSNAFNSILDRMSKVIHRINVPFGSCPMMISINNAVKDRVTHNDVWICHINFSAKDLLTILVFSCLHLFKEGQVFFYRPISERWIRTWRREIAAGLTDLIRCLIIYIGLAQKDKLFRIVIHLREVVRCIAGLPIPGETQPFHISLNGVYIFPIFLSRVSIIKTKVS